MNPANVNCRGKLDRAMAGWNFRIVLPAKNHRTTSVTVLVVKPAECLQPLFIHNGHLAGDEQATPFVREVGGIEETKWRRFFHEIIHRNPLIYKTSQ